LLVLTEGLLGVMECPSDLLHSLTEISLYQCTSTRSGESARASEVSASPAIPCSRVEVSLCKAFGPHSHHSCPARGEPNQMPQPAHSHTPSLSHQRKKEGGRKEGKGERDWGLL